MPRKSKSNPRIETKHTLTRVHRQFRIGNSGDTILNCSPTAYVDGLARAIGEAHRRYTRHINFREGWRGYLDVFIEELEKKLGRSLRKRKPGPKSTRTKEN